MNIKNLLKTALSIVFATATLASCVHNDDWDTPPINCENKFAAPTISLKDFIAMAPASGTIKFPDGEGVTDVIIDGYVVSSDEHGNFYKTISFQDAPSNPTAGMQIEVDKSGNFADYPVGTHIRIRVNGLVLGLDRGTVKLGAVDPSFAIGRIPGVLVSKYISGVCNGNTLDIQEITPLPLASLTEAKDPKYLNMLVSVPNVQFPIGLLVPEADRKTYLEYANGIAADTDRTIEDATGGSALIRNSAFVTFGKTKLPIESGTLTFVVSRFMSNPNSNPSWQMYIRSLDDVNFTQQRFDATPGKGGTDIQYLGNFTENFESYSPVNQEVFPRYINDPFLGNRYWQLKDFGGNKYIQLTANAGQGAYKTYFIVPVDFTTANQVSFRVNVGYYTGNVLKVYTSTDYVPMGDISAATLTDITSSFTIPTAPASGYGVLTNAGSHTFNPALQGNGFVIFEYTGANPGATTTIQLDDITVN